MRIDGSSFMAQIGVLNLIGYIAAASTTLSFIPQIINIRKEGGASLSYLMLSIYWFGLALWLIYGIMLHASAVIIVNAASIVLVALAIVMKALVNREHTSNLIRRNSSELATGLANAE
jgi:MtN3 and saliva related transmembrane protein